MENQVFLRAGTPNDANRDYLPEAIKGSDMVVNENGNNSQPYPERLQECTGTLTADGLSDRWYEYVPASYDGSKPVPLVVSNHGGLMTGWGQAIYTSWTMLADREGFICVFPDAHQARIWQVEGMFDRPVPDFFNGMVLAAVPKDYHENHDLNFVKALIDKMQEKYNIDKGRIFMQGMSAGNLMTGQFCRYYGDILAGAAGSGGPTQLEMLFTKDGELLVSCEWFCRYLLNLQVSSCDDVVYITDHFSTLSANMADLIRELLYGKLFPESFRYMEYQEVPR